ALAGGCRRKVVTKAAGPCPRPEALAALVAERGRELRTGCAGYPNAPYWMAGALSFDAGTRRNPKLVLLAGGQGSRTMAFDVQPAPLADIARLIAASDDVRVRIKLTQSSQSLVRLGVWARPKAQPG